MANTENDIVKHPSPYCYGKYEPKDVIRDWRLNFNLGSAVKYISDKSTFDKRTIPVDFQKISKIKKGV